MAKREVNVSPMEKSLVEVLVLNAEQLYTIPDNWMWIKLGDVAKVNPPKISNRLIPKSVSFVPMAAVSGITGTIEDMQESLSEKVSKGYTSFLEGDIIFAKITPCMENGKVAIAKELINGVGFGSTEFYVLRTQKYLLTEFLYHLLRAGWFKDEAKKNMAGAVGQLRVRKEFLLNYTFPLPPLTEQKRIVERIESLFKKLDRVKELAQTALDCLEIRKAAILHKAFTGDLTAKWREENGFGMDSWKTHALKDIAKIQTGLAKGKKNLKQTSSRPYLRVANVQDGFFDLKEVKEITVETEKIGRYTLHYGDVLLTEGGDYDKLGRGAVWQNEITGCLHQNHIFAVRPFKECLDSHYLAYLTGSSYGKAYFLKCAKQTTNLASINSTQLKVFPVLAPTLSEQREIVHILNELFDIEQHARKLLSDVIVKIDLMKKIVLARAFRGELGTNDLKEENSFRLLFNEALLSNHRK